MNSSDGGSNDRTFERIMRNVRFSGSLPPVASGVVSAFARTKELIARAGGVLEDERPDDGILETERAIYKVISELADNEGILGDIAIAGAVAFDRSKHFCVVAPLLRAETAYRIEALGQAKYFQYKNLTASLLTSNMQIERFVPSTESRISRGISHVKEAAYWNATAKAVSWIFVAAVFYVAMRRLLPYAYADLFAVAPFWLKAFYGNGISGASRMGLIDPKWRLVQVNTVVAPILAFLLLFAIPLVPAAIPYLTIIAVFIDFTAFLSVAFTRSIVPYITLLPRLLR